LQAASSHQRSLRFGTLSARVFQCYQDTPLIRQWRSSRSHLTNSRPPRCHSRLSGTQTTIRCSHERRNKLTKFHPAIEKHGKTDECL